MTTLEILEEHRLLRVSHLPLTHEYCNCNEVFESKEAHRAHVAEVLDKHMQEREENAWEEGAEEMISFVEVQHLGVDPPSNPYRTETPNGS